MSKPLYKNRKRRKYNFKRIILFILGALIILAGIGAGAFALLSNRGGAGSSSPEDSSVSGSSGSSSGSSSEESSAASVSSDPNDSWQLMLINPSHPLPSDFSVDLTMITGKYPDIPALDNMQVDSRIVDPLLKMFQDAAADGQHLFLRASYRTQATQQSYYDWHMNYYKNQGYTEEQAKELTLRYIAYPGCSEHQTGLACDIISVDWQNSGKDIVDTFDQTTEAKWLKDNAYKYGFIMRYPKDKEDITKIGYEPWHFRYVGVAHATEIYQSGQCLEEYLGVLN